ncbi:MAG: thiamine phosphate synthase [Pseudomonadota bacterium]
MTETPQIYLLTPPQLDPESFAGFLAGILDRYAIACLRLTAAGQDADALARAADTCREIAHARDIPLVIDTHSQLVQRLGLDGVHLHDARGLRDLRRDFGPDPIIGASAGASRHDGMAAGEAGADYITFGPVGETDLGAPALAEAELFAWWSEMIEVPVVAEGGLTPDLITALAPITDFFAIGPEIWHRDDPAAALAQLIAPLAR